MKCRANIQDHDRKSDGGGTKGVVEWDVKDG